jgi:hypothetical protein
MSLRSYRAQEKLEIVDARLNRYIDFMRRARGKDCYVSMYTEVRSLMDTRQRLVEVLREEEAYKIAKNRV